MPPKKKAAPSTPNSAGQKRKRTIQEKMAEVKRIAAEEKKKMEQSKQKDDEEEEETKETPAKKRKPNPKNEQKPATSASPRRAGIDDTTADNSNVAVARKKDPPVATAAPAMTPPRAAAGQTKKKSSSANPHPFNSPKPTAITAPARLDDAFVSGVSDADNSLPLFDINSKKDDGDEMKLAMRPTPESKVNAAPKETGDALVAPSAAIQNDDPVGDDDDREFDSDDDLYDSEGQFIDSDEDDDDDDDDDGDRRQLEIELRHLQEHGDAPPQIPQPPKRSICSSAGMLILMLFATGIAGFFCFPESFEKILPLVWDVGPSKTICFYDSPHFHEEKPLKMAAVCLSEEIPVSWHECPSDATCRGGTIIKCPDGFIIETWGCALSDASNETLKAVVNLLQEWTAKDICKGHPERYETNDYGNRPLFHYSRVTGELELGYNLGLVQHGNHSRFLLKSTEDGNLWIGLHPKVNVPLNVVCMLKLPLWEFLRLSWICLCKLASVVWTCIVLYIGAFFDEPFTVSIYTVLTLALGYYARKVHVEKCAKEILQSDEERCLKEAEAIFLKDTSKSIPTGELNERVSFNTYPMSKMSRKRIVKIVMPKVISKMQANGKIKQKVIVQNGQQLQMWNWVDKTVLEELPQTNQSK